MSLDFGDEPLDQGEESLDQYELWKERRKERPVGRLLAPPIVFEPTQVDYSPPRIGVLLGIRELSDSPSERPPLLTYKIQLIEHENITVSTGYTIIPQKDFYPANWPKDRPLKFAFNVIAESDESNKDDQRVIGRICYLPALNKDDHDSYSIEVFVPKLTFHELVAAARIGRFPSRIIICVEGMSMGPAPDGSIKTWDNKSFPELDVIYADFTFSERRNKTEFETPPTSSQVRELSEKLDFVANEIRIGWRFLFWASVVIILLLIILRIF